jgi:hypothetical protein
MLVSRGASGLMARVEAVVAAALAAEEAESHLPGP